MRTRKAKGGLVNDGKGLENKLGPALRKTMLESRAFYHRFYDTRSAFGGCLPSQPGDYMLLVPGMAILIEAKSTVVRNDVLDLTSTAQIGKHLMWNRAGHPSLFVWAQIPEGRVEIYLGADLIEERVIYAPIIVGALSDIRKLLDAVVLKLKPSGDPSCLLSSPTLTSDAGVVRTRRRKAGKEDANTGSG